MDKLVSFESLELPIPVRKALDYLNISCPTEIQAQAIPLALAGKDLIGLAQTGTGKTLAFCLPLVTLMDRAGDQDECALILAPTREIAIQVTEVIKHLTLKMTGRWHPVLVIGGVGMQPQVEGLSKSPRFIVATPGRLVDHMREGKADLSHIKFLVLDEADRMLDMGFAPQLNEILAGLPSSRQTMLFSATFPDEIADISRKYLLHPERVEVGPGHSVPIESIQQETLELEEDKKFETLLGIIAQHEGSMIVFTRTKYRTEKLSRHLEKNGIAAGRIHGDRSQSQRQATLSAFKEGSIRILVATDIAARGIDVPDVGHVINYDIPNVPEEYIHRIGRTGRAGANGHAVSFITPEVREEWRAILKLIDPELYAKTPHVPNVPRPEKPQQNRPRHKPEPQRRGPSQAERPQRPGPGKQHHRRPYPNRDRNEAPQELRREDDLEGDYYPQPSLEEQLSRIDRGQRRDRHGQNARRPQRGGSSGRNFAKPHRHQASSKPKSAPVVDDNDEDDNIGNRF